MPGTNAPIYRNRQVLLLKDLVLCSPVLSRPVSCSALLSRPVQCLVVQASRECRVSFHAGCAVAGRVDTVVGAGGRLILRCGFCVEKYGLREAKVRLEVEVEVEVSSCSRWDSSSHRTSGWGRPC